MGGEAAPTPVTKTFGQMSTAVLFALALLCCCFASSARTEDLGQLLPELQQRDRVISELRDEISELRKLLTACEAESSEAGDADDASSEAGAEVQEALDEGEPADSSEFRIISPARYRANGRPAHCNGVHMRPRELHTDRRVAASGRVFLRAPMVPGHARVPARSFSRLGAGTRCSSSKRFTTQ